MDKPMSNEESYSNRRQLFKSIWDTAINMETKDTGKETDKSDPHKTKIIKTLRLDEVDRCLVGKRKKQRIRNLRTVCNKILDFCDKQDADDTIYEQMVTEREKSPPPEIKITEKKKRSKRSPTKRKVKTTKSLFTPFEEVPTDIDYLIKEPDDKLCQTKITHKMRPLIVSKKTVTPERSSGVSVKKPQLNDQEFSPSNDQQRKRRIMKNKQIKRKTISLSDSLPTETNVKVIKPSSGRPRTVAKLENVLKKPVAVHKITF